jgi:hypothetical protein
LLFLQDNFTVYQIIELDPKIDPYFDPIIFIFVLLFVDLIKNKNCFYFANQQIFKF